jgi:hypothetical protein
MNPKGHVYQPRALQPWGHHPVVVTILTLAALLAILEFGLRLQPRVVAERDSQRTAAGPQGESAVLTDGSGLEVNTLRPHDGDLVDQFTDVVYELVGRTPAGSHATVLVRDPLGQYWSWGPSSSGEHNLVQLGMPADHGRKFQIGVLITSEDVPRGVPTDVLPRGVFRSISVTRR